MFEQFFKNSKKPTLNLNIPVSSSLSFTKQKLSNLKEPMTNGKKTVFDRLYVNSSKAKKINENSDILESKHGLQSPKQSHTLKPIKTFKNEENIIFSSNFKKNENYGKTSTKFLKIDKNPSKPHKNPILFETTQIKPNQGKSNENHIKSLNKEDSIYNDLITPKSVNYTKIEFLTTKALNKENEGNNNTTNGKSSIQDSYNYMSSCRQKHSDSNHYETFQAKLYENILDN